jgi:hypothetical protein
MSKMNHWREDPDEELACMIERGELSTFWNSNVDLVIGPGETLIWIKDGKIEDVVTQSRLNNIGGGFRNWLSTKVISGQDVKMLIVDNKPFKIQIGAEGNTSDNVIQEGTATLTLRLNHEQANRIAGVLKEKAVKVTRGFFRKREVIEGYETKLLRSDIEQMFAEEANAKVFGPTIRRFSAAEFGSSNVGSRIESAAQIELRNTLDLWGMSLENVYVSWGSNEYQKWMATRAPTQWSKIAKREDSIQDEKWKDEDWDKERERKQRRRRADFEDDLDDEDQDFEIEARKRKREKRKKEWDRDDRKEDRVDELDETVHSEGMTDIKADHKRTRDKKEWEQDKEELSDLMDVKDRMHANKMEKKRLEQEGEQKLAGIKADADKSKYDMETYEKGADKADKRSKDIIDAVSGRNSGSSSSSKKNE